MRGTTMNQVPEIRGSSPEISIIIPTYNRSVQLAMTLSSLVKQKGLPPQMIEILVVDDGSEDDTRALIQAASARSQIGIHYANQHHKGPAAARNLGIQMAQGQLILFIGDDIVANERLVAEHYFWHTSIFPRYNEAVLGYAPMVQSNGEPSLIQEWVNRKHTAYQNLEHMKEADYSYFYTCNISLKRDFLLNNGIFNAGFPFASSEDIELGMRLHEKGMKLYFNVKALGYHNHPLSVIQFINRCYHNGRSSSIAQRLGIIRLDSYKGQRNKLSPFRDTKISKKSIFLIYYLLSLICFLTGKIVESIKP